MGFCTPPECSLRLIRPPFTLKKGENLYFITWNLQVKVSLYVITPQVYDLGISKFVNCLLEDSVPLWREVSVWLNHPFVPKKGKNLFFFHAVFSPQNSEFSTSRLQSEKNFNIEFVTRSTKTRLAVPTSVLWTHLLLFIFVLLLRMYVWIFLIACNSRTV